VSELELSRVSVEVRGRPLLREVSLRLERGDLVALVGPNGAGKTSLLRAALGLLPLAAGSVRLDGADLATLSARERAARVSWLPQQAETREPLSVLEVVRAARYRFRESRKESLFAAESALSRVGISALVHARITELSGGERQRVRVAALLAQEARLALLDEPANHLDPAQQLDAYRLFRELWATGLGILLVTHDVNLLSAVGDVSRMRVVGLARGEKKFESTLDAGDLPAKLGELFGVEFASVDHAGRRLLVPQIIPTGVSAA
jgi:iron complex transport system ATP-binding protein